MKKSLHIINLFSLVALCLLTSCLPSEPYTDSEEDIVVEKRIIGSWIGKSHRAEIELVNSNDYKVFFELHGDFIEQSMDFKIIAEGNLYRYEEHLIGQFKASSFKIGAESKSPEYQDMNELQDHYILGIVEEIDNESFIFYWLPAEAFGSYKQVTTKIIQEKLPELIKNGKYKNSAILFTKLTENFTAEQYYARERAKKEERRKYCLDIVSGEIPIQSIIDKYLITSEELSCLAGAIGKQKEIDNNTLAELLELNLPVRGFVNISRHENSTNETKRKAVNKILFSDRKNFEGGNPLAEKRDNRNRIIAYNPIVTEELLQNNANLLESNPEWYNKKEFIDFIFNVVRIGITSPETIDFIVGKINEVLTMHIDGESSTFINQPNLHYLLRDIYLHNNITEKTRRKMLNFYNGEVDTEKKKKLIASISGALVNDVCTVYWAKDEEVINLIDFTIEKYKSGAGISGVDYGRIFEKNILPIETLVELAKQNPFTIYGSLPKINDKKDLSDLKAILEDEIKSLEMEVNSLKNIKELSTNQKNIMYRKSNAIKNYSSLLIRIEEKIGPTE